MKKISILHISDIHFDKNEPENQGLILTSFFKDLASKIADEDKDNTYCIISGDLVNRGSSDKFYNDFYDEFILKLTKYIPIRNIYCSPGNHDLNRKIVEANFDAHAEILSRHFEESEFNDFIKDDTNLILQKFAPYEKFCKEKLHITNFNLYGYSTLLVPEISLFFLNCALFSSGGYKKIDDKGVLKVETSELNRWVQENDGRTKMLIIHHPLEYLTQFAQQEIKAMLKCGIDILISGHIHEQELDQSRITSEHEHIKLGSPQLFSDKQDMNGYAILTFNENKLESIEYREWVQRQRKFMVGQSFSGTDDGIRHFDIRKISETDQRTKLLLEHFQKAMKSYAQTPNWIERSLTTERPNPLSKNKGENLDYIDIINKPANYQIIAAPQFGLTCYAKYLALKAWEIKKENWLYFDSETWNLSRSISEVDDGLTDLKIGTENVNCIILDNWRNTIKDSGKILTKLRNRFPDIPIIILSNYHDQIIIGELDSEESHEGFKQVYLKELNRNGLRNIVRHFNSENQIAEENRVLERLNLDLVDLNIHRTPLNCLQLLLAFQNNFEDRPINRSKVFTYLLKVIFENPGNLFYGNTLDEENCIFILGNFCEFLLRNNKESFSESEFLTISTTFTKENYNTTNIPDLLQVLKHHQILVSFNGELRFRFSYWIYYFAAARMRISKEFGEFMISQKHSLYYPEIIEFYTGTDGAREDVVKMIIQDLKILSEKVHKVIGLEDDINPFSEIKWALNERVAGLTQQQLEEKVRNSKLPDEIKDVVADTNYNSIRPYTQTINDFFEEYDVRNLMSLIRSGSRALRNSEFISAKLKEELIESLFNAWQEMIRVLILIAPVLAKHGFGGVGGARFRLSDKFPTEYAECMKTIVVNMPYNIMNWYKDDVFSDKLMLLLNKYITKFDNPIVQHIIALLVCATRPHNWKATILEYIGNVGKNSYYLGDLYVFLCDNYATKFMPASETKDTEYLIKACFAKHKTGSPLPGSNTVGKIPDSELPARNLKDLE